MDFLVTAYLMFGKQAEKLRICQWNLPISRTFRLKGASKEYYSEKNFALTLTLIFFPYLHFNSFNTKDKRKLEW